MPAAEQQTLLSVRNLTVYINHPTYNFLAIRDVSFYIRHGETLALVGESGSGKTLTALALLNLLPKRAHRIHGQIKFAEKEVGEDGDLTFEHLRGKHVAMIFQEASAALNPVFRVGTQIADVIKTHLMLPTEAAKKRVFELLRSVGFSDPNLVYRSYPHQLSGGMAQRVMIAMALSCSPQLIIADEPTTSVDVTTQMQILKLIKDLQKERQFALLLITHDMAVVAALADSIIVMNAGRIIERGATKRLLAHPDHSYTQSLISSIFHLPTEADEDRSTCQAEQYF
jgi:ABC-type dipeptide/oligopeptide/nickel transport system ATPase component